MRICKYNCKASDPKEAMNKSVVGRGVYCSILNGVIPLNNICLVSDKDFKQYIDNNKLEDDEDSI